MEKKVGEVRHRVMLGAGHLTMECGSVMVLLLFVMVRMEVMPAFRQASIATPNRCCARPFRHHDRFPTVHQFAMLKCGTADTVLSLLLIQALATSSQHLVTRLLARTRGRMQSDRYSFESMRSVV